MNQLDADLDAIFTTLDSVEVAYAGQRTRGFRNDAEAEARLPGYPSPDSTRQVGQESLLIRRGTLPALEAKPRPEGEFVLIDGVSCRVQTLQRMDDGRVLRLAVVSP